MRKIVYVLTNAVLITAVAGVFSACGGPKLTVEQKAATGQGLVKKELDECQKLANQASGSTVRAWGEGVSAKESFATNQAELDARTKIARQLEITMEGMISNYNEKYDKGEVLDESGKAQELQQGYVNKVLTGTRVVCSNTYITPDGKNKVYVCVELSEEMAQAAVKKLSAETKLQIDFAEHNYRQEMEKAREQYNKTQGN
jgi:hypothetical protein